ncbi:hypothetical protein HGRIS_006232 [Hohenbuehelia grisea]|uniref:Uncharacterized protein n=1 Tax=Hohenbuehelia grisea TaxID=104357 RepID=A0ABR3K088_9AGAR
MPSPFATQEDPSSLWYEQSNYVSTHIAAIGYGVQLAIFAVVMYCTIYREMTTWRRAGWITFNTVLFVMGTINLACSIHFNESAWVSERNYPNGAFAFLTEQQSRPVLTLGNTASIICSFMADGLLLYRVMVLWDFKWYIIILPTLFFIACIILSIMVVIQIALPLSTHLPQLALPVWIVLMIINIVLTAMIATRLLMMRRTIKSLLGDEHSKMYTGVAAIVIESALPFSILSIVLLALFGDQNIAQNLFVPLLVQFECIAPQLIVLRVILGQAASRNILKQQNTNTIPHSIRFAPGTTSIVETGQLRSTNSHPGSSGVTLGMHNQEKSHSDGSLEQREV